MPQWTANGVAVCTAAGQPVPSAVLASDGAGGAVITWYDDRSGSSQDIYAQRVDAGGGTHAGNGPANGVAVCTAAAEPDITPK